jgi:hypothetical protein
MRAFLHHNHNYLVTCMVLQDFVSQEKEELRKTLTLVNV